MRNRAAWPLLAVLAITAAAACGAAATELLLPPSGYSRRSARLLQAPANSTAAGPKYGRTEMIVPTSTDQNTGMACLGSYECATVQLDACSLSLQVAAPVSLCSLQQP